MIDEVGRLFLYVFASLFVVLGLEAVYPNTWACVIIVLGYMAFIVVLEVLAHFLRGDD